ncbi:hypothetical protein O3M35_008425 [Rhynocoris fuscipes]|uniref:RHD domain-containing protein n=1 Tax=Rhynocoris fuscipes TaxID=488301 RepID=A0AAW1D688_9HEMI
MNNLDLYLNDIGNVPQLEIIEQPQNYFGFRYITEYKKNKPYGPLTGVHHSKSNKTFPTVRLNNYNKKAIIRCWLCDSNKKVHLHQLLTKNNDKIKYEPHDKIVNEETNIAIFEGLNIIHAKTKDEKSLQLFHQKRCHVASGYYLRDTSEINEADLLKEVDQLEKNKVLLYFEAYDYETKEKLAETYSCEIKNTRNASTKPPKIARQSIFSGKVQGDEEVLIFVDKVPSDIKDIEIVFFELDQANKICWHAKAKIEEIWHQYGIAFRTPPYRNLLMKESKTVFFKIVRVSDNSSSNNMVFDYQPDPKVLDDYLEPLLLGKKRRLNEVLPGINLDKKLPSELNNRMEEIQNFNTFNVNNEELNANSQEQSCFILTANNEVAISNPQEQGWYILTADNEVPISNPQDQSFINSEETHTINTELWPGSPAISLDDEILLGDSIDLGDFGLDQQIVTDMPEFFDRDSANNSDSEQLLTDSVKNIDADSDKTIDPSGLVLVKDLFKLIIEDNNESNIDETIQKIKSYNIKLSDFSTAYDKNPLHIATEYKKFAYVKPLVLAGVKVNALDSDRNSPLHLAVYHNASPNTISFLLSKGADISLFNSDGETPIHLACRLGRDMHLKFLIPYMKTGATYCSKKTGDNPLHVAVKYDFLDLVNSLLKEVSVFSFNNAGFSPLDYAVKNNNEKMVSLLLNSLDLKEKKNFLLVAVALSRDLNNDKMKELLTDYLERAKQILGISDDETVLCEALNALKVHP